MSRDEIAVLDGNKCVLQLCGVRPFLSDKYDLTQHPNYKYTADFDKKYIFDIEKFLNHRMKLKAIPVLRTRAKTQEKTMKGSIDHGYYRYQVPHSH